MEIRQLQKVPEHLEHGFVFPVRDEELVCANCGFEVNDHEAYAYHTKLCSIPA
jgi:succinate dehydrogenase/fumarate reductase-like Fe-S protein